MMANKTPSTDKMLTVFAIAVDVYRDTIRKLQLTVLAMIALYIVSLILFAWLVFAQPKNSEACIMPAIPVSSAVACRFAVSKSEKFNPPQEAGAYV